MFINFHTHLPDTQATLVVENIIFGKEKLLEKVRSISESKKCYSIGFHPWFESEFEDYFEYFEELVQRKDVLFVGECGIDKVRSDVSFHQQRMIFQSQLELAEKYHKPVIIHCVRALDEILEIRKNFSSVPWIFHGFQHSERIAMKLIDVNIKLSVGVDIMRKKKINLLRNIPLDMMFIETDSAPISVVDVYQYIARTRQIPLAELQKTIQQNFFKLFHNATLE